MTTGLNPATFENLQLGAGLFLKNFDDSSARSATELRLLLAAAIESGEGIIGATRGGGSFQCTPALRSIEADGLRSPAVGATVNDGWTVKLTGTSEMNNSFKVKTDEGAELVYTVKNGEENVNIGDTVLAVNPYDADNGNATLSFSAPASVTYAGTYKGTVTFTVSVDTVPMPK